MRKVALLLFIVGILPHVSHSQTLTRPTKWAANTEKGLTHVKFTFFKDKDGNLYEKK